MIERNYHPVWILSIATVFGVLGDMILRTHTLGLNYTLWFTTLAIIVPWKIHRDEAKFSDIGKIFFVMAILLSAVPLLSDDSILKNLCTMASFLALYLASITYHDDISLVHTAFSRFLLNLTFSTVKSFFGLFMTIPALNSMYEHFSEMHFKSLPSLIRGLALSIPLAGFFLYLFISADQKYEDMISKLWDFDPMWILQHWLFTAIFGWLALSILAPFFLEAAENSSLEKQPKKEPAPWSLEIIVILCSINLVFMSYVYFQLGYLFGGAEHILNTENLTLANYARRGFFESLIAAALVLVILLSFDESLQWNSTRIRKCFVGLSIIQIALVLIVILSALQRMNMYRDIFGLTEYRFYVYAILMWMLGTFIGLSICFLKHQHHRKHFILGSVLWGYACLFSTIAINPHAHIATVNINHIYAGGEIEEGVSNSMRVLKKRIVLDTDYLTSLSDDAAPVLYNNLEKIPEADRMAILKQLHKQYEYEKEHELNSALNWCWSRHRARAMARKHKQDVKSN